MRLGGEPPVVGTRLVRGFACYETLTVAEVVAVYATPDVWAALVRVDASGRFEAVEGTAVHAGLWRSLDRAEELPPGVAT